VEDAVRRHLDKGRPGAMSAIGIAVNHFLRGDGVVGSGWVGRAQRLLRDEPEGPEHGYALYLEQEAALAAGGTAAVAAMAGRVRGSAAGSPTPTWSPAATCSRGGP
jgi:hypothetical protein